MCRRLLWPMTCWVAQALCTAIAATADSVPHYAVVDRISGPLSAIGWDYATIDGRGRRLFVATSYRSGGGLTALDLDTQRVSSILEIDKKPHGIVILDDGVAAVADAAENAVLFFDQGSGKLIASVQTGRPRRPDGWHNPDSLLWEPRSGLLVAVNKDSDALSLIDVARHAVVGSIHVRGELEMPGARGDGTVYVNLESKGAIAVVDVPGRKVVRELPLKDCEEPTGLAYDAADSLIVSVCSNGLAKFVDPESGSEQASIAVGKGADAVMYDSVRKIAFIAGGDDATLSVIHVDGRRNIGLAQTLATQPGTRLGAVDLVTGKLYLPTAKPDLAAPPLHLPGLPPIPPAAQGSFEFLVVAPQP